MDELIIDEKKYISSKHAAKLTGYAKDYVGQLCREGRVQAQLVGRSWYVLESAIMDHRFGTETSDVKDVEQSKPEEGESFGWTVPRYAVAEAEPLPLIEKSQVDVETVVKVAVHEPLEAPTGASEPEQTLEKPLVFDMRPSTDGEIKQSQAAEAHADTPLEQLSENDSVVTETAIERSEDAGELDIAPTVVRRVRRHRAKRVAYGILRTFLIVSAVVSVVLATLNSGLLDEKISSLKPVFQISGISTYKK